MKHTTRRDFIKISSAGAGTLMFAGSAFGPLGKLAGDKKTPAAEGLQRTPTYCEVCFWKCAGWVYSDGKGNIKKIIGNEHDPHSNGRMCPRGTGGVGMYHDEDRLKKPLIREGKPGEQYFREASWEEALDLIAKRTAGIRDKYGAESIALFAHGSAGSMFTHLMKSFGTPNITAPSFAQCRGPREVGFKATFGEGVLSPERTDIRDTKCLVLIGSHIGENMHNGQIQEMSEAIDRGATIITVDPRHSTAASHSKFWLPIKPATDIALLLAWMHVIINEELYDKKYVEKYTYGFDLLKAHVKDKTPEWAYGITTIEPSLIRKTAREMAHASPAVLVHPGRHVTWYGDDAQRSRAIAILNAILGSWGRRGGFYFPTIAAVPKYPVPAYPKTKASLRELSGGKYPLADEVLTTEVVDATIDPGDNPYPIKSWFVAGTNIMASLPDSEKTLRAINNLDFLVVVDTMPMDTTGYADVVLPECTYLERYDFLRVSPHREPYVALRMPAAEPKYDSKPSWWMARELAKRWNLQAYFPWEKLEDMLDWQLKKIGSSLEEMKKIGVKKFPREYDDLYGLEGEEYEFNTNTGKIELYSTDFATAGYDPIPVYKPHAEPPAGFYRLNYGRAPMHTFSRTSNNPNLFDLMDENTVWVNPRVARLWGIENGQKIWLQNQDGIRSNFPVKVRVTERIRWDSVFMVHGFGHTEKRLTRAYGRGANDSRLITQVEIDPIMGGTGMRNNFVTFLLEEPDKEVAS